MKVMHVLNSRVYSGAEKVVSQIIRSFENEKDMQMVYCSPESDMVRRMLLEQQIPYVSVESLTPATLKQVIRREKPDLIHAHDMRASFVAALCCGSIPVVSHIHNNAFDSRGISPKSIAYILAAAKAKHILWVSQSAYEGYAFHSLFKKKSRVLYNIIDTKQVYAKLESDENTYDYDMIFVGRLTYPKDPQRLMQLCALLKARKPDVKVAIVGSGELEGETKSLWESLGLQDNVEFLGFRSNPMKMIQCSKAMILTSRWEGTPMCALEAMALGTPVVSTPTDGLKVLIDDGINGCLGQTNEELAEKLLKIFDDPAYRTMLSENTKKKFASFNDEEAYRQAILDCYR